MNADKRFWFLLGVQAVATLALAVWILIRTEPRISMEGAIIRETAAKLQAAGIQREAIRFYETFLTQSQADPKTKASMAYSLGQLYENEGDREKALAWYYQVEGYDRNSKELSETQKRIVALLESMGKVNAAKAALGEATRLEKPKDEGSPIVAQLGARSVHLSEINTALDSMPKDVQNAFSGKEGKAKFLRKYLADQVLFEKAKRLQYDRDPRTLSILEEVKKQWLVQRIVEEEVLSKISVDEADLKNFFKANSTRYSKDKKPLTFEQAQKQVETDYRIDKGRALYEKLIEQTLANETVKIFAERIQ